MIEIRTLPREDGLALSAEGHAEMAPYGRDVVCAGISALLFGYLAYLRERPPDKVGELPHLAWVEGEGVLQLETCGLGGADLQGWSVVEAGIRLIAEAYPDCVRLLDGICPRNNMKMEVKSERYE